MKFHPKKICLLFVSSIFQKDRIDFYINEMPELKVMADVEPVFFYGQKTADLGPKDWLALAQKIRQLVEKYDGFVIVHDLDNLLYTASALSFLLSDLAKPVVFTGSLKPQAKDSGIKSNIINSCQLVGHGLAEVCLLFGNKILRANQASRNFSSSLNLFQAPESGLLGQIDFSIRLFNRHRKSVAAQAKKFIAGLDDNILIISAGPLMDCADLKNVLKNKSAAAIKIGPDPMSSVAWDFFASLSKNLPVIIFDDHKISEPREGGFIYVDNMTFEAMLVKLMFVLKQTNGLTEVQELMSREINGEIIL